MKYEQTTIFDLLNKNTKETIVDNLKKYINESNNSHQDFYNNLQINTYTKREDCIMIYNFRKKCIGPIYCAEMLDVNLFEG